MTDVAEYDPRLFPFLRRKEEQQHVTEPDVEIPPALVITDKRGDIWTLGFDRGGWRTGEYEFDVVRAECLANGVTDVPRKTGEHACRIVFRRGVVWIYGEGRWRHWNGRTFI